MSRMTEQSTLFILDQDHFNRFVEEHNTRFSGNFFDLDICWSQYRRIFIQDVVVDDSIVIDMSKQSITFAGVRFNRRVSINNDCGEAKISFISCVFLAEDEYCHTVSLDGNSEVEFEKCKFGSQTKPWRRIHADSHCKVKMFDCEFMGIKDDDDHTCIFSERCDLMIPDGSGRIIVSEESTITAVHCTFSNSKDDILNVSSCDLSGTILFLSCRFNIDSSEINTDSDVYFNLDDVSEHVFIVEEVSDTDAIDDEVHEHDCIAEVVSEYEYTDEEVSENEFVDDSSENEFVDDDVSENEFVDDSSENEFVDDEVSENEFVDDDVSENEFVDDENNSDHDDYSENENNTVPINYGWYAMDDGVGYDLSSSEIPDNDFVSPESWQESFDSWSDSSDISEQEARYE
jgi:hypothetical protein